MLNPRRVLPHDLIYDRVWGYDFGPASNALRVYVGLPAPQARGGRRAAADPHRARRRLRAARAMSLRTRIAAAAGLAVAVAVVAAAAVRLPRRARRAARRGRRARCATAPSRSPLRGGAGAGAPGVAGRGGPPAAGFGRRGRGRPAPFGGAAGFVQFVAPDGAACGRAGEAARAAGRRRARSEIARDGEGRELRDIDVDGTHLRVLTAGLGRRRARSRWRGRSTRWTASSTASLLVLLARRARRASRSARGARARWSRGRRWRRSRASPAAPRSSPPTPTSRSGSRCVGDDELARLARSFNTTLDALERSVEAQRQLVADASHELRTPIASLRANIQTLRGRGAAAGRRARGAARRHRSRSSTS